MSIGIWADGPPPSAARAIAWAQEVASLPVERVSLFLPARSAPLWRLAWAPDAVIKATAALRDAGKEVLWCVWPVADVGALRGLRGQMEAVWAAGLRAGVEPAPVDLDLEGGKGGWGASGRALVDALRDAVGASPDLPARVNCVPPLNGLRPQDEAVALQPWVSRVALQTYSQWRADKGWTHHSLMRPVTFQRHGAKLARDLNDQRSARGLPPLDVSLSLIVSSQQHPDPHPQGVDALDAALGEVIAQRCDSDLWSLKNLSDKSRAWLASAAVQVRDAAARRAGGGDLWPLG